MGRSELVTLALVLLEVGSEVQIGILGLFQSSTLTLLY